MGIPPGVMGESSCNSANIVLIQTHGGDRMKGEHAYCRLSHPVEARRCDKQCHRRILPEAVSGLIPKEEIEGNRA